MGGGQKKGAKKMDDHLFDMVWDYGQCELIPRFNADYKKYGTAAACPSYPEIKDYCKVLNVLIKWDYTRKDKTPYKPTDLLY